MRFGAGCTLGCGKCTITANTVQLFYWPETRTNAKAKRTYAPITVSTFDTTFVSPTVYVFYSKIYASNSCGRPTGLTHLSTFIPVNTNDLSSVWADVESDNGFPSVVSHTASFNLTDLNTPVPASIYQRQPWCASLANSRFWPDLNGPNSITAITSTAINSSCPQARPYDPILVVPLKSIQAIDPDWLDCEFDLRNSYDPPFDLQNAPIAAAPTPSSIMPTQPATPASVPEVSQPPQTGGVDPPPEPPAVPSDPQTGPSQGGGDPGSGNGPHSGGDPASNDPGSNPTNPPKGSSPGLPAQNPSTVRPGSVRPQTTGGFDSGSGSSNQDPGGEAGGNIASLVSNNPQAGQSPTPQLPNTDPGNQAGGAIGSILASSPAGPSNAGGNGGGQAPPNAGSGPSVGGTPVGTDRPDGNDPEGGGPVDPQNVGSGPAAASGAASGGGAPSDPQVGDVPEAGNANPQVNSPNNAPVDPAGSGETPSAGSTGQQPQGNAAGDTAPPPDDPIANSNPGSSPASDPTGNGASNPFSQNSDPAAYSAAQQAAQEGRPLSTAVISGPRTTITALQTGAPGQFLIPHGSSFETISANGPAVTVGSQIISAASNGVVVDGRTQGFSAVALPSAASNNQGQIVVPLGSTSVTLSPGAPATILNGQTFSAASNGLIVGTSTVPFANNAGSWSNGQLIAPFTFSGTPYTSFQTVVDPTSSPRLIAPFTISGTPFTAFEVNTAQGVPGEAVIPVGSSSETLIPGGPAETLNGQVISAAPDGLVIGSNTKSWSTEGSLPTVVSATPELVAPFTIAGSAFTALETSILGHGEGAVIPLASSTITLSPGGSAATLDGQVISMASSGLVVGGSTEAFTPTTLPKTLVTFEISGTPFTAFETSIPGHADAVEFSGPDGEVTLWPGAPAVTVDGEVVSAASSGLVVDGSTETYSTVVPSGPNAGDASGPGGSGGSSPPSASSALSSSASRQLGITPDSVVLLWGLLAWVAHEFVMRVIMN
ncbi:MAG: hypothetical protein M1820_007832 [Bogoriella megaspora]|nr:MAG: hypothetical protein M1820_007832 [Bogoriella megaspora]